MYRRRFHADPQNAFTRNHHILPQVKRMDHCEWCSLSEEDKRFQVYESRSWFVFLADEQDYIGRCILVLKRHCGSLSEMTDDEWDELRGLVRKVEACLKAVLGATLCNWS